MEKHVLACSGVDEPETLVRLSLNRALGHSAASSKKDCAASPDIRAVRRGTHHSRSHAFGQQQRNGYNSRSPSNEIKTHAADIDGGDLPGGLDGRRVEPDEG
jgi:hypothetical protein